MNVLVTGGAGYIGSHTAKALAAAGFEPVVLDDLSAGHASAVKWGPLIQGNIADRELVADTVRKYRIHSVIHFAAHACVAESMHLPDKYFQNNVVNTLSLLDAVIGAGVSKVVFSSSCATYGIPERLPIEEDQRQSPVNPYGESKLFIEKALRWYSGAYRLGFVALRYFNAAGADPDGELGECHTPETHLIPRVIQAAAGLLPALRIYGTDYATDDGTAIRDYVHVSDLAAAHVKALAYLLKGGKTTSVNLGMGAGHSVMDVIRSVEKIAGVKVPFVKAPQRPGDPPVLLASIRRAQSVLGWAPRITELDEIVDTAWQWHLKQNTVSAATFG